MRLALWLYLELLVRLPAGLDTLEINPMDVALEMGLPEGTVRSWLGDLRRLKYLSVQRLNGSLRLRIGRLGLPEPPPVPNPRFFTVRKLERAIGEAGSGKELEAVLRHPDDVIRRALAGVQAVPDVKIRKSRTALFLYLVKRYAQESQDASRH